MVSNNPTIVVLSSRNASIKLLASAQDNQSYCSTAVRVLDIILMKLEAPTVARSKTSLSP